MSKYTFFRKHFGIGEEEKLTKNFVKFCVVGGRKKYFTLKFRYLPNKGVKKRAGRLCHRRAERWLRVRARTGSIEVK